MASGIKHSEVDDLRYQLDNNFRGDDGPEWLQAFKKFLRKENPWPVTASTVSEIVPWRTVTLGLHKTPAVYRAALQKAGFRIRDDADDILNKLSIAEHPYDITLVMRSVADLGFTSTTSYDAICARAKDLGFELCPAEVGPALRLAYADQAKGDWFRIAMEPLTDRDRALSYFVLVHDGDGRRLRTDYGDPYVMWSPLDRFVFLVPSPSVSIYP